MRILLLLAITACGTTPLPPSAVCEQTDECEDGLACLEIGQTNGGSCMVVGKVCSITCTDDTHCMTLGPNFRCFAGCGAEKVCGEIATP